MDWASGGMSSQWHGHRRQAGRARPGTTCRSNQPAGAGSHPAIQLGQSRSADIRPIFGRKMWRTTRHTNFPKRREHLFCATKI